MKITLAAGVGLLGLAIFAVAGCDKILPQTTPAPTESSTPPSSSPPTTEAATGSSEVYDGINFETLKSIITAQGAAFTEVGENMLRIEGGPLVLLTQCQAETSLCYEISINRTFSNVRPTPKAVNDWNLKTKIPEASIDEQGFLHFEFWVTTVGLTSKLLVDSIGWFEGSWQSEELQEYWKPFMSQDGS